MATIRKRNKSYEITVSCGYDMNGRQVRRSTTYTPEEGMTERQIEKEVKRRAVLFEERCESGQVLSENMKFSQFAEMWFEDRKQDLRPKTYARYQSMMPRINAAIGHLKLSKIQPTQLRAFYKNLAEGGIRTDTKYSCTVDLAQLIKPISQSKADFARKTNISINTLNSILKGGNSTKETAQRICKALSLSMSEAFCPVAGDKVLADKTVLYHHRLISSILSTAVEWGVLFSNPCERTKPPKVKAEEPKYLNDEQALILLELLDNESTTHRAFARLLLFTGMRRGEALGLKWSDIDFENGMLNVCRSLQYLPERGIYEDETKNTTSKRIVALPTSIVEDLKAYKQWQARRKMLLGDAWKNEQGYIFTSDEGEPLHPDSVTSWFSKLMKTHSDELPYITLHSLRHTNATLQIVANVPITTVANRLGHANAATTGKIYAHAIESANKAAANELENILNPNRKQTAG